MKGEKLSECQEMTQKHSALVTQIEGKAESKRRSYKESEAVLQRKAADAERDKALAE